MFSDDKKVLIGLVAVLTVLVGVLTGFSVATYFSVKDLNAKYVAQPIAQQAPQMPQEQPFKGPLPSSFDTKISYADALKKKKPVVVEFYADWCPHCRHYAPTFHKIGKEYRKKATFVTVNSEKPENQALVRDFKIPGFPSIYIVNPKTKYKVNVENRDNLKEEIDAFIKSGK